MISKNKDKSKATSAPSPVTFAPEVAETESTNGGRRNEDEGDYQTPEQNWDYALIGKLSHTVHSFDELVDALYVAEGFERSRAAVAQTVRRMNQVATNPKRPLPKLLNPEVIPNARPRIDWEGIAAEVGGSVEA